MRTLLIIGAGEFGQLVKELAGDCGYEKIDFLDDNSHLSIGKITDYSNFIGKYQDFIVAIGNPIVRKRLVELLQGHFQLATLVHKTAVISRTAKIGKGCVIEAHTVVNTNAQIEKACFINAGSVINHNSIVNEYCQIDCNAVVAADAVVPKETKVFSCTVWSEK